MRAIRIRREAPVADKVIAPIFKREDLVFFRGMADRTDLGFKLMRVLAVLGFGEQEMVTVSWLGSSDYFEVKAADIDKAPIDVIRQGARLYATIAIGLQQHIDMADNDDIVRLALHAIEGEDAEPIEIEDSDSFEGDTDQGEEDVPEFDSP